MPRRPDDTGSALILLLAFSLALLHMPSGIPAPFYPIYQDQFGIGSRTISMFFVTYILGVVIALVVAPRLIFFRYVLVVACAVSIVGNYVLLRSNSVFEIYMGHLIHGLVLGVITVVVPVVLGRIDVTGQSKIAGRLTTSANAVGLTAGPLWAGLMLAYVPSGDVLVWWLQIAMTLMVMPFLSLSLKLDGPVSVDAVSPDTLKGWRRFFEDRLTAAAILAGFVAFASGGLLAALGSVLADSVMGTQNAALQGLVVSLCFALSAISGAVKLARRDASTITLGVYVIAAGVVGMVGAIVLRSLPMFLVAAAVTGIGQGLSLQGATQAVAHRSGAGEAGRSIASFFLFCYTGTVFSSFGVGIMIGMSDLVTASLAFCMMLVVLCAFALRVARRSDRARLAASPRREAP